ncbi:hypothetical protein [Niabella ginsengisoli]|uniref:LptF/LptG family permease n=1 Tax=Niabella ginsengisoli TaxID=522298 RepID=A0ABS9SR93_9BACT|nr:hypothetical protein [Niabella ginsengisoli]MCH5600776.1 hypothetical protein [Niabella ginsengisoli]
MKVLPAGINYSSFYKFGNKIHLHFGDFINADVFDLNNADGINYTLFNEKLKTQLQPLVYEVKPLDKKLLKQKFGKSSLLQKIILAPFALAGALLHAPLYWTIKCIVTLLFGKTDHFTSIMFGLLLLTYPFYLAAITIVAYSTGAGWGLLTLIVMPLLAFSYVKYGVRKG